MDGVTTVPVEDDPERALYSAVDRAVGLDAQDVPLGRQVDIEAATKLVECGQVEVEFQLPDADVRMTPTNVEVRNRTVETKSSVTRD
jgi:hypothetical protein